MRHATGTRLDEGGGAVLLCVEAGHTCHRVGVHVGGGAQGENFVVLLGHHDAVLHVVRSRGGEAGQGDYGLEEHKVRAHLDVGCLWLSLAGAGRWDERY